MGTQATVQLANLGMADSLILMVMALVVFGPRRLPQIGRQIGKLMYEFRKASNDFKFQMEEELRHTEEAERRQKEEERLKALALAAPATDAPATSPPAIEPSLQDPQFPVPDPYPGDALYPSAPAPAASPDHSAESPVPRIQPPSTGELVAAARPGDVTEELHPSTPLAESAASATVPPAEQAAHNG